MRYIDILAKFLDMFPNYMNKLVMWGPCGTNSIKVNMGDQLELKFTYVDDRNWSLAAGSDD